MKSFITEPIIISNEQSVNFLNSLIKPDEKYIFHRNAIFNQIDRTIDIHRKGMDMDVELQDLDLSFIDEMESEKHVASWFLSFQLENLFGDPFDFWNSVDKVLPTYTNLKEDSIMHEAEADSQMQIAA